MNTKYTFEVLKTTAKGAMLITDNNHVAWVSPRSRRADGTFGLSAKQAIDNSVLTLEQYNQEQADHKDPNKEMSLWVNPVVFEDYSEKSYRICVGYKKSPYNSHQMIRVWEYLTKSQVLSIESVNTDESHVMFSVKVPQWVVWNKKSLSKFVN